MSLHQIPKFDSVSSADDNPLLVCESNQPGKSLLSCQ